MIVSDCFVAGARLHRSGSWRLERGEVGSVLATKNTKDTKSSVTLFVAFVSLWLSEVWLSVNFCSGLSASDGRRTIFAAWTGIGSAARWRGDRLELGHALILGSSLTPADWSCGGIEALFVD